LTLALPPNVRAPEVPDERAPAVLLKRPLLLKKCCEPTFPARIDEAPALRPDGLKLSRDGVTGILPPIIVLERNESALTCS
jgi:hypothetical protein